MDVLNTIDLNNFVIRLSHLYLCSSLFTTEAAVPPSASHHPAGGSHLRPERFRGATYDCARENPAGQIQAAAG